MTTVIFRQLVPRQFRLTGAEAYADYFERARARGMQVYAAMVWADKHAMRYLRIWASAPVWTANQRAEANKATHQELAKKVIVNKIPAPGKAASRVHG